MRSKPLYMSLSLYHSPISQCANVYHRLKAARILSDIQRRLPSNVHHPIRICFILRFHILPGPVIEGPRLAARKFAWMYKGGNERTLIIDPCRCTTIDRYRFTITSQRIRVGIRLLCSPRNTVRYPKTSYRTDTLPQEVLLLRPWKELLREQRCPINRLQWRERDWPILLWCSVAIAVGQCIDVPDCHMS